MKVEMGFLKCMESMARDMRHPYIPSTTVLGDISVTTSGKHAYRQWLLGEGRFWLKMKMYGLDGAGHVPSLYTIHQVLPCLVIWNLLQFMSGWIQ